jgi:release factor glutamine methyltransferase
MRGRPSDLSPRPRRRSRLRPSRPPAPPDTSPLPADPPRTVRDAVRLAEEALDAAGIEESVADARLLLAHALGTSPTWIFSHETDALPARAWEPFRSLVARRCDREPLQYLRGQQEFFGLRLVVGPKVLIPRPETEHLVERLIERLRDVPSPRIADVGTGSGCIAIAAAREIPGSRVTAGDVSAEALETARANARELGVEDRIRFVQGSLGEPLRQDAPFHAIAANLPYVTSGEWEGLQPEVRDFEPKLALVGGDDGLDLVRELVAQAPALLSPGGWIVLEVGHEQGAATADLLRAAGFVEVALHADLAGVERIVEGRKPQ